MSLRSFLPTLREWLWFFVWIAVILVLTLFAVRWRDDQLRRHGQQRTEVTQGLPVDGSAHNAPAWATTRRGETKTPTVAPAPVARVAPSAPASRPSADFSTRHVTRGDARLVNPEEVAYVKQLLAAAAIRGQARHPPDLARAHELAGKAHSFGYVATDDGWALPEEMSARGYGNCRTKTLWLAVRLLEAGYTEVGIKLGCPPNYRPGDSGHAWPVIFWQGHEYVFEPTASGDIYTLDAAPTRNHSVTVMILQTPQIPGS